MSLLSPLAQIKSRAAKVKSVRVNVHTSNTSQAYLIEVAGLPDASKVRVSTFCGAYSRSIRKGTKPVEAGTEVLYTRKFGLHKRTK